MFSDSRWWYTYVVSVSFPDGDAALLAPYAQRMLSADLPNRVACYDKQLTERLRFRQPVPVYSASCNPDV